MAFMNSVATSKKIGQKIGVKWKICFATLISILIRVSIHFRVYFLNSDTKIRVPQVCFDELNQQQRGKKGIIKGDNVVKASKV